MTLEYCGMFSGQTKIYRRVCVYVHQIHDVLIIVYINNYRDITIILLIRLDWNELAVRIFHSQILLVLLLVVVVPMPYFFLKVVFWFH